MTGGMLRDLARPAAARFSFFMSIPVMIAAGLLVTLDVQASPALLQQLPVFLAGFLSAGVVGYLSIRWLLRYLIHHSFYVFAIYCAVVGAFSLVFGLLIR
jgi:undecaprenyl-diphosphatase